MGWGESVARYASKYPEFDSVGTFSASWFSSGKPYWAGDVLGANRLVVCCTVGLSGKHLGYRMVRRACTRISRHDKESALAVIQREIMLNIEEEDYDKEGAGTLPPGK